MRVLFRYFHTQHTDVHTDPDTRTIWKKNSLPTTEVAPQYNNIENINPGKVL